MKLRQALPFFILIPTLFLILAGFQNCSGTSGFLISSVTGEASLCVEDCLDEPSMATPSPTPATTTPDPSSNSLTFASFGISSIHRYSTGTMSGGWGAHLGHLLRSSTNVLWFVDDGGNDPHINTGLTYFRFVNGIWTGTAVATFPGIVQQNTGSLMSGPMIYTYGLDVQNKNIVECYMDTSDASFTTHACNSLPFDTGADSNYIGATISKSGSRVVWWTNTSGVFSYIYNFGGGWNGPVSSPLGGYAGFSYVYARLADDNSQIDFLGAAARARGGASVGYDVLYASTNLGTPPTNWLTLQSGGLGMETWRDPRGGIHMFVYGAATPQYFYKPLGGSLTAQASLPDSGVVGARIVQSETEAYLVQSFANGNVSYRAIKLSDINGAVAWSALPSRQVQIPSGLGVITVFPESFMYQTTQPRDLTISINGSAQEGLIYMVRGK